MSVFDAEMSADLTDIFKDAGHVADYQGSVSSVSQIRAVLDRGYEVYDENQVAMHVATLSVRVVDVPHSKQGDIVTLPADEWLSVRYWEMANFWDEVPKRQWTVQQTLKDDGFIRRLWVS